jgi:dipeptidyl aminopeptidase/acylaminoacyl peptidase
MENNLPLPSPEIDGMIEDPVLLDDGRLLFVYSSPARTDDIWMWNYNTKELKQLTFATYSGIDQSLFVEPVLVRYKSFDGLEIPAFMYLPPDYDGQPVPFIIAPHGGPELQSRPYFVRNFQYFLLNGLGIFSPNVRGSKGYGKEFLDMDNYKKRMNSIKDIKAGVDYLIENKYTAHGKIGIMGGSYGGFVVLASITEYPGLFSAAVDRVGIANFVTFLKNTKDYRRHIREAEYGPLTDEEFLKSISPIHKAHLIKTPLLVTHGENDARVPVSEARQIIKAVNENGGVVDSLFFPDEGHNIVKKGNKVILYRKIAEFFNKYLKN